jgi:hypothetical protein
MQRSELLGARRMEISKNQHVLKPIFSPGFVAAASLKDFRILECPEKHVPQRYVSEIVCVMSELMVYAVGFRSLKYEPEPRWSLDIPVIEEFPDRDQDSVIAGGANTPTKERIHD